MSLGMGALVALLLALAGAGWVQSRRSAAAAQRFVGEFIPAEHHLHDLDEAVGEALRRFERYHRRERVSPRRVLDPIRAARAEIASFADPASPGAAEALLQATDATETAFGRLVEADESRGAAAAGIEEAAVRQALGRLRTGLRPFARGDPGRRASASMVSQLVRVAESGLREYLARDRIASAEVLGAVDRAADQVAGLRALAITAAAGSELDRLEGALQHYRTLVTQYADDEEAAPSESSFETLKRLWDAAQRANQEVNGALTDLTRLLALEIDGLQVSAVAQARTGQRVYLTTAALGLVAAVALSLLLTQTLRGRIQGLERGARKLAEGELTFRLPEDSGDALGRLAAAFNAMAAKLEDRDAELRQLATALSQAEDGVLLLDDAGVAGYANPAFFHLTGWTAVAIRGLDFRAGEVAGSAGRLLGRAVREAMTSGCAWSERGRLAQGVGASLEVDCRVSPVTCDGSQIRQWAVTLRNVSEQAAMEGQVRETQKLQAIGTLTGGIAHEFNNLLLPITAYGSMVLEELPEGSKSRRRLSVVLDSAERAKGLVDQLQTFSQPGQETFGSLLLGPLVKATAKLVRASLPESIQLEVSADPDAPAVQANPTQIQQVTLNLLSNALHAVEGTDGRIQVRVEAAEKDLPGARRGQGAVCLAVSDSGHGMDPEIRARIFEPLFTTKPPGQGSGLGLSVAHRIVADHGGLIEVESAPGQGAIFRVYLPAASAAETASPGSPVTAIHGSEIAAAKG